MLKKLATIIMTGALFLAPFQTVNAAPNYFVTLNGVRQNVTPIVQDGTTLLPVATVGKLIGYQATWDNKTKSGTLENESNKVRFKLGSYTLVMEGKDEDDDIAMPQPVKVINGKTYLPLRVVGETLGINVGYNGSTGEISLQTKAYRDKQKYNPKYDNLTIEEYDNLSLEEYQMMTKAQRDKMEKKSLDEYNRRYNNKQNNKDTEQEINDTEQPKEEKEQDETPSAPKPETEEERYYPEESNENVNLLPDNKIRNMNFTQAEINYILRDTLTEKEQELYNEINNLRKENGLAPLPLNMELTKVARAHVIDSNKNNLQTLKDSRGQQGNLHGWSISKYWTGGAYTPDHKYAQMMWDKPRELSNYRGDGYEISTVSYGAAHTPTRAVDSWNGSPAHKAVILTSEPWGNLSSFGVGIDGGYACAWFGKE